jgi:hypothetical protein
MRNRIASAVLCAALCTLSGCHGGGSALPTLGSNGAITPQAAGTGSASFTVSVPATGTAIPQSVVVTLATGNGKMTPLTMNLRASTTGCTALIGGGLKCLATVSAPIGTDAFVISTYSGPNGMGTRITSAQANVAVKAFDKNACSPTRSDLKTLRSVQ